MIILWNIEYGIWNMEYGTERIRIPFLQNEEKNKVKESILNYGIVLSLS